MRVLCSEAGQAVCALGNTSSLNLDLHGQVRLADFSVSSFAEATVRLIANRL
jgi:hypothetical protein